MINYRYSILEKLGEGGSGEVFLAEDTRQANQQVALKILHPLEKSGSEANEAFHNEVSALVNLSHPNLVRIFDFGTIRHADEVQLQQRRYFSMEVIRGVDALEWISSAIRADERSAKLETLLLQALSVLSYVHHEGVIHFDIKPQNFVIVGSREAASTPLLKLTDFGFSTKQDDSLDIPIRGTLEYTAPELLKGNAYDHRIDLYSLGATFYHLLEGHCPFEAKDPIELAKRVLADEVSFSQPATTSSMRLRKVIGQLMQKDPVQRCKSAEEAAASLVMNMAQGKELLESYFGFTRKPKIVGRKSERRTIEVSVASLLRECAQHEPAAIIALGGEGIGKSTLLEEGLKFARAKELFVYEIESMQTDVPFAGIVSMLDRLATDVRSFSDRGKGVFEKYDRLIGFDTEEVVRFEVWGRQKENVVELVSRFILDCSEVFPLVIGVDNAELLDESSLNILKIAIRDGAGKPLLLLATATSPTTTLFPSSHLQELNLGELAAQEISEMSIAVFGVGDVANEIGLRLYALYGGTPGVIVEALNAVKMLVPGDALRDPFLAKNHLESLESRLPRNIDDFLIARYQKLSRERQLILSILSCFHLPAKSSVLSRILPFHPERSAEHIRFLLLDGLVGTSENENALFIRMKKLKDAVFETIKAERDDLHAVIAATLEQDSSIKEFSLLQEAAFQFSCCREYNKACTYYEMAADEGVKLFALQRALQLCRDALNAARLARQGERASQLEVKYASILFRTDSYREVIDYCRDMIKRLQFSNVEKIPLFRMIGLASSRLGENEQAQEYINLVLQFSTDEIERLELRQELVGLQISAGHFKEAEKECIDQLGFAREMKNDRLTGAIYTDLGIATFFQDQFDRAAECFVNSMRMYEAIGEKTQVTNSMINIGNALSAKGDFAEAIAYWEKAFTSSQECGTLNQQALIQNNLGIAHYNLKQYDKAKLRYNDARQKYERNNSKLGLAHALINLGEVHLAEGEYEAALNSWVKAKELYIFMDSSHALAEVCLHIANVLSRLGDQRGMENYLNEAGELIEKNALSTFRGKYHFLQGVWYLLKEELSLAECSLEKSRASYASAKVNEYLWHSTLRLAECLVRLGKHEKAVVELTGILQANESTTTPQIVAEAYYLLGTIATAKPQVVSEKAIVYFKSGIDAVMKEPVSETTWKLAFALAREYYERGQRDKAKEFLMKTKLILEFFLSHFSSAELKQQYLRVDQKERVFATIESITKK